MTAKILLYMLIGTPDERAFMKASAKYFCERHLIASPEQSAEFDRIDQELDAAEDAAYRERERDELGGRFMEPQERGGRDE
jgi:hypothetical protein